MMSTSRRATLRTPILHVILFAISILWLFPVVWTLTTGLKDSGAAFTQPWQLPSPFKFSNYTDAWEQGRLGRAFTNSLIVTTATVIITLLVAIPAAYALARFRVRWRALIYAIILMPIVVPPEVVLVPMFLLFRQLGLLNSLQGLIVVNTGLNLSIATLLLTQFFRSIPIEIEEAASMDGASRLRILTTIVLPLSRAGLSAVALFIAVFTWNEYFNSLVIVQKPDVFTIQLAMTNFSTAFATDQGLLFAALGLAILPPLIAFVFFQRKFAEGLTQGAIKG